MRTFTDEILDDRAAEILRRKTPAQRLEMASRMWLFASEMIRANLRRDHLDWDEDRLRKETARRMARESR